MREYEPFVRMSEIGVIMPTVRKEPEFKPDPDVLAQWTAQNRRAAEHDGGVEGVIIYRDGRRYRE